MPRSNVLVVSDAGPIIHLDELNALDLLAGLGEILIPSVVWNEVQRHRPTLAINVTPNATIARAQSAPSARLIALFEIAHTRRRRARSADDHGGARCHASSVRRCRCATGC